jgi:hypothetical protein
MHKCESSKHTNYTKVTKASQFNQDGGEQQKIKHISQEIIILKCVGITLDGRGKPNEEKRGRLCKPPATGQTNIISIKRRK